MIEENDDFEDTWFDSSEEDDDTTTDSSFSSLDQENAVVLVTEVTVEADDERAEVTEVTDKMAAGQRATECICSKSDKVKVLSGLVLVLVTVSFYLRIS